MLTVYPVKTTLHAALIHVSTGYHFLSRACKPEPWHLQDPSELDYDYQAEGRSSGCKGAGGKVGRFHIPCVYNCADFVALLTLLMFRVGKEMRCRL
jgi:hypothetical protein